MKAFKLLGLGVIAASFLSFTPLNKKIIVLDAGHGGDDFGTQRENVYEKDIALKVAQEIEKLNQTNDTYEIILTRNTDENVPLSSRTEKINQLNPVAVISLHVNSSAKPESVRSGHEIYTQSTEESKKLAKAISSKLGDCPIEEKNLHILRNSKSPAVLVELGFMNSTKDRTYLSSKEGQKEVAEKFNKILNEL
ncbi:N-acetylmuramoyl-L-alanine amidase [Chryseobacterium sp.]|uniref:N-acetylmuramoyl-L-alanine amidase family protein n=1 Tax=Chryseobacterium sp. TaxID=1871047 RepID=UPI00289F7A63|nr:N-acetylmuramoyl-L-alanine amidase [Chryseobacterium sp.]